VLARRYRGCRGWERRSRENVSPLETSCTPLETSCTPLGGGMQLVVRDAMAAGSAAVQATVVLAAPLVKQPAAEVEERLSIAEAGRRVAAA